MNVLIDLGHPAHVHLYRNLHDELVASGHRVFLSTRDISAVISLLDELGLSYHNWGKKSDSVFRKVLREIKFGLKMVRFLRKHHIDLAVGSSMTITHACLFTRAKSIVFDDDDSRAQMKIQRD